MDFVRAQELLPPGTRDLYVNTYFSRYLMRKDIYKSPRVDVQRLCYLQLARNDRHMFEIPRCTTSA